MKKILLISIVLFSTSVMANTITCNTFGSMEMCQDSYGNSSTTHHIGNTYITNGSNGYSSTTHKIGDDMYMGHDNRGNSWNIYDNNSYRNY